MRVLVVGDIHANWAALSAIREEFDVCLCVGDLVDYGVEPGPCIRWVQQHCRYVVRGNHDHGVVQRVVAAGDKGFRYLAAATRPVMWQSVTPAEMQFLAGLPTTRWVRIDGKVIQLVHATPRDPLDEYVFADEALWARRLEGVDADILCVGHTHQQFALTIGNKVVLNPGSVGQPRDGDPRAAYAIIEDGQITLKRIEYPIEQAVESYHQVEIEERAKRLATEILRHGGRVDERLQTLMAPHVNGNPKPPAAS